MKDDLFAKRMKNWQAEGEFTAFNLACVAEALDTVKRLSDQNVGWEVVERRLGEYKSWDPDIIKVDKDTENGYSKRLEEFGTPFLFLSEEAGTVEINKDAGGPKRYVVCDPFDGSYLFKHGIPAFWYSSLAFFDTQMKPTTCAVGDCYPRVIAYANEKGAFLAHLDGEKLLQKVTLDEQYRESMGRPYGFVDVAEGKIDCYFARRQPFVDVFSGIYIAQQSGAVVTDFDGNPVKFVPNEETVWDVVASTNPTLHEQVLASIAQCKKEMSKSGEKAN